MKLVVCETVIAYITHVRDLEKGPEIKLSGHSFPRPRALCGVEIAWDTKLPLYSVSCRICREKMYEAQ